MTPQFAGLPCDDILSLNVSGPYALCCGTSQRAVGLASSEPLHQGRVRGELQFAGFCSPRNPEARGHLIHKKNHRWRWCVLGDFNGVHPLRASSDTHPGRSYRSGCCGPSAVRPRCAHRAPAKHTARIAWQVVGKGSDAHRREGEGGSARKRR